MDRMVVLRSEVGIYTRNQESKRERRRALDQVKIKKKRKFLGSKNLKNESKKDMRLEGQL